MNNHTITDWAEYKRTISHMAIWVGISGKHQQPCRILTISKDGVRVKWADGRIDKVHPEDLRPL